MQERKITITVTLSDGSSVEIQEVNNSQGLCTATWLANVNISAPAEFHLLEELRQLFTDRISSLSEVAVTVFCHRKILSSQSTRLEVWQGSFRPTQQHELQLTSGDHRLVVRRDGIRRTNVSTGHYRVWTRTLSLQNEKVVQVFNLTESVVRETKLAYSLPATLSSAAEQITEMVGQYVYTVYGPVVRHDPLTPVWRGLQRGLNPVWKSTSVGRNAPEEDLLSDPAGIMPYDDLKHWLTSAGTIDEVAIPPEAAWGQTLAFLVRFCRSQGMSMNDIVFCALEHSAPTAETLVAWLTSIDHWLGGTEYLDYYHAHTDSF